MDSLGFKKWVLGTVGLEEYAASDVDLWDAATTPVTDFWHNIWTGSLSDSQVRDIAGHEYLTDKAKAIAQSAGIDPNNEAVVAEFVQKYWPARSIPETVWDVAAGDPLGVNRSSDGDNGLPDFTFLALLVVAVVLLLFAVKLVSGR